MSLALKSGPSLLTSQPRARQPGWQALLAVTAGMLQAFSLAWPWQTSTIFSLIGLVRGEPLWCLQLLALAVLVGLVRQAASVACAAWLSWWFAMAWLAGTFAWMYESMHRFGGLSAWLAALAVLALAGALALYYALAGAWYRRFASGHAILDGLLFAGVWLLAEMGRGVLFTGFGWGAVGYAHVDGPLSAGLPWVGLYGVSALAAFAAALLVSLAWPAPEGPSLSARRSQRLLALAGLAGVLALVYALPRHVGQSAGSLQVTLLQGNISQGEKFDNRRGIPQSLDWYQEQLQQNTSTLVITPETALPVLPAQLPKGYWQRMSERFAQGQQAALIGMPLGSVEAGYSNSVLGLKPDQDQPWRYDKSHLVPFGEFIPPLFRWFTEMMSIPLGDFQRGAQVQRPFEWQGQRLSASVCYENLFSEELGAQFKEESSAPTIMVNVSNLAWFGEHLAMDQHLHIARARAIEFARPFLLATNTGRTAVVDHLGRVTHQLENNQTGVLKAIVDGRVGLTPYAQWVSKWGLWPLLVLALLSLAGLARWRRG